VIAGQGTAALELLAEVGEVAALVAPIGGGGLLSGTTIATAARCPDARVIGAEPAAADDARRSLETGQRQPAVADPATIADGLPTGIGARPFAILRDGGVEVVTVGEDEIVAAATFHLERMKLVVEPSGATGLAAVRRIAPRFAGRTIGVIVSGGNTDLAWLR
jgi:threonine dehydratase